ncbi:hypothetical protein [Streptomyces olivoreticuli]|nr:hypothetical protein [Streptomyces olivoreticuli]
MSPTGITRRHAVTAAAGLGLLATPAIAAPQPLKDDKLSEAGWYPT